MDHHSLPFLFARDHQVLLSPDGMIAGPEATPIGLREGLRCAGSMVEITQTDADSFQAQLMKLYQTPGNESEDIETAGDSVVLDERSNEPPPQDLLVTGDEGPVIRLVNHFLRKAIENRASDVHVEPYESGLRARMRVDGFLQTMFDRPATPAKRVISRLKVMAGLDIAETRLPQDGHIALRYGGRSIDIRVSTLAGKYGERVVMRVLDKSTGLLSLSDLGLRPDQIDILDKLSVAPNGIVFATGPTGSGKTTTLYSMLKLANNAERNIVTVEDPIEYELPGINQSQIHSEIGLTFAAALRAALRQDPDIILVGEVRDNETGTTAAQAALTGHLVFSSLHANSSVAAITRLRDLGLDNYLIAATLRAIIAQRLLRRLCTSCKVARAPNQVEINAFRDIGLKVPDQVHDAVGCATCLGAGHQGRAGIFEIAAITEPVRAAIDEGASEQNLKALALDPSQTLFGEAMRLVAEGVTDFAEVSRVVGSGP